MTKTIDQHEGKKYLRTIYPAGGVEVDNKRESIGLQIDVYCVLEAFNVTCPATAHAIKKLLTAGERGKGDRLADLIGAEAAISRAIELEKGRQRIPTSPTAEKDETEKFIETAYKIGRGELPVPISLNHEFDSDGICSWCGIKSERVSVLGSEECLERKRQYEEDLKNA